MIPTPPSLLERLRHRPATEAWDPFVELYTLLLYCWANRLGLQTSDAADLVQEVIIVLLQRLPAFISDPEQSFRAWLRTVTLHAWRARGRKALVVAVAFSPEVKPGVPDAAAVFWEAEYKQRLVQRAL